MFDIISVEITNFKSFYGTQAFAIPKEPGLYFLAGRNFANPSMGGNGVGKSTILDAIYWALYGRTSRGLKAGDVISWGQKSCAVTLRMTVSNDNLEVIRTQAPNSLSLMGKPIDQQELQKHLRLSPDAFLYAIMTPQFGERFLDLAPAAKLTLFSQILELDYWLERSKAASGLADHIAEDTARCERACAEYRGKIDGIRESLKQAQEQEKGFAQTQAEKVKGLECQSMDYRRQVEGLEKQYVTGRQGAAGANKRLAQLGPVATKKAVAEHDLSTAMNNLKRLEKLGPSCPTCLQLVDKKYIASEQAHFKTEITDLEGQIKQLDQQVRDYQQIERNKHDFESELMVNQGKLQRLKERDDEIKQQIQDEKQRTSPYKAIISQAEGQLQYLKVQLQGAEDEIRHLSEDHAAVSYWVNGFKRLRLFIVEDTLRQLEVEVNSNLASLGLLDWRIEFDVERENKSGGVTKGFTVLVHAPGHEQPVKYEAWSGGELQRLRLAADLGLANLIMNRAGMTNSIEMYDEPSAHLSDEGLLDLAETLMERALTTNKRILLVDHRLIDYAFSGTFHVVKDGDGSRLERDLPGR